MNKAARAGHTGKSRRAIELVFSKGQYAPLGEHTGHKWKNGVALGQGGFFCANVLRASLKRPNLCQRVNIFFHSLSFGIQKALHRVGKAMVLDPMQRVNRRW